MSNLAPLPSPNDPEQALAAVASLRLIADKLERKAVTQAIKQGWTWTKVAEALGITRQAAHKKYSPVIKNIKE